LLGTLHLAVDRRMRCACTLGDLSETKFEIRISQ
jgi:hypothetical protein